MVRHIVLLTFADDAPTGIAEAVVDALSKLPGTIPEIASYQVGLDLGLAASMPGHNASVGVVAEFADATAYGIYRDHPDHRAVIENLITPHLEIRSAIQMAI